MGLMGFVPTASPMRTPVFVSPLRESSVFFFGHFATPCDVGVDVSMPDGVPWVVEEPDAAEEEVAEADGAT